MQAIIFADEYPILQFTLVSCNTYYVPLENRAALCPVQAGRHSVQVSKWLVPMATSWFTLVGGTGGGILGCGVRE